MRKNRGMIIVSETQVNRAANMHLTHFFQGSLGREEVASAFLAMALEGCHRFRDYFLSLVASPELADSLKQRKWRLSVEANSVDVRMESDDIVILIENKISSAPKKKGQLLRYYTAERARPPDRTIVCLYLAPGEVGQDEVLRVKSSPHFRSSRDYAQQVSWDAVSNYETAPDDVVDGLIQRGLARFGVRSTALVRISIRERVNAVSFARSSTRRSPPYAPVRQCRYVGGAGGTSRRY